MASMAHTDGIGSPQRLPPRKPEESQDSSYRNSYETTPDGSVRHFIPQIAVPSRIQDAPKSPVRINFQNDEWAQASTVQIENITQGMRDSRISGSSQQYQGGSEATIREAAKRQVYPEQGQRHASHAGILSNMEGSPQPYNDESPQNGRRSDESGSSNSVMHAPPLNYHGLELRSGNSQQNRSLGEEYPPGRHLTPITTSQQRRSYMQRPNSTYSAYSDQPLNRGYSPGISPGRENRQRRSPDGSRPGSYVDLNGQYPQVAPTFDNSGLRTVVGNNASLLSTHKTLAMYRANLKSNNDPETHYSFALLLIDAAREQAMTEEQNGTPERKPSPKLGRDLESPYVETPASSSQELIREARKILEKLAERSFPYAQYYLGDGYFTGFFNKGKEDHGTAFTYFIAASKHGHAESSYRAALCYEFGWGTRKDVLKARDFYKVAATKNHPGAMTRLGRAGLYGDLGDATEKEAIKWLKRAADAADMQHNDAPFYLGTLYETGFGADIFKDEGYAAQLYTTAADLGQRDAAFRLGEAYEHGQLSCPRDPSLSVHFYTMAAAKGHNVAMFNLCAWYMVGAEPVLEKDEDEAYEWAKRAAEAGMLANSQYFVVFGIFGPLARMLRSSNGATRRLFAVNISVQDVRCLVEKWKICFPEVDESRIRAVRDLSTKLLNTILGQAPQRVHRRLVDRLTGRAKFAPSPQLGFEDDGFWPKLVPRTEPEGPTYTGQTVYQNNLGHFEVSGRIEGLLPVDEPKLNVQYGWLGGWKPIRAFDPSHGMVYRPPRISGWSQQPLSMGAGASSASLSTFQSNARRSSVTASVTSQQSSRSSMQGPLPMSGKYKAEPRDSSHGSQQSFSTFMEPVESDKPARLFRSASIMSLFSNRSKSRDNTESEDGLNRPRSFRVWHENSGWSGAFDDPATPALTRGNSVASGQSAESSSLVDPVAESGFQVNFDVVEKVDSAVAVADVAYVAESYPRENRFLTPEENHERSQSSDVDGSPKWTPDVGPSSPTRRGSAPELPVPQTRFTAHRSQLGDPYPSSGAVRLRGWKDELRGIKPKPCDRSASLDNPQRVLQKRDSEFGL